MMNERLKELVSPRVGLVRDVGPQGRSADEPMPPYLYTATLSNFDFRVASRSDRMAAGKGMTKEEAMTAAIGEATERYCAYHWDPQRTFVAKAGDIKSRFISPQDCVLYSDRQYNIFEWPHPRWTPDRELAWLNSGASSEPRLPHLSTSAHRRLLRAVHFKRSCRWSKSAARDPRRALRADGT